MPCVGGSVLARIFLIDDAWLVGAAMCPACCCGTLHGRWPYPISEHEELQDSSTNAKLIWRLVRVVLK